MKDNLMVIAVTLWTAFVIWNCASGLAGPERQFGYETGPGNVAAATVFIVNAMLYGAGLAAVALLRFLLGRRK